MKDIRAAAVISSSPVGKIRNNLYNMAKWIETARKKEVSISETFFRKVAKGGKDLTILPYEPIKQVQTVSITKRTKGAWDILTEKGWAKYSGTTIPKEITTPFARATGKPKGIKEFIPEYIIVLYTEETIEEFCEDINSFISSWQW